MPTYEILPTCEEIAPIMMFLSGWIHDCNENDTPDGEDISLGTSADCNGNRTPDECEFLNDFDGDGVLDVCDGDTDDDGVPNESDACPFTPLHVPVGADGRPIGDSNFDCDVGLVDFGRLTNCLVQSGPGTPPPAACLRVYSFDDDDDTDLVDVAGFMAAFTGGP
jgi:hypothetical protein